ncbi:unnamed protein product [Rotaria magnacalcarata]|uniref:G-protein coupled receptors family 2 profile 2 domain-containing protein n=1 Tax=Rotaria magnacalcarata TaxID=392030 RepID=A0A816RJJ6_9BILA|nr:unnamed protein product [Rotaria magnacalcarata]CAF2076263.1 unnamed protein product [Rotaria magnacalcarata]CAF4065242.1 unnamed protein product [Rotaria magnacalcarata]CAF4065383.1 unnamed protein product [Rotaria magnacalcarata]
MMKIIRFCLIYLLNFGIYLAIVNSSGKVKLFHDEDYKTVFEKIKHERSQARFIKSYQAKTNDVQNQIYLNDTSEFMSSLIPLTTSSGTTSITQPTLNATYIITSIQILGQDANLPYNPDSCDFENLTRLQNGTCVSKFHGQIIAAGILNSPSNNVTDTAYAISLYMSSVTQTNQMNVMSVNVIDNIMDNLHGVNLTLNSNSSFLIIHTPGSQILGASFSDGIGGRIVDISNKENLTHSNISAAAIINEQSLNNAVSLNMLIVYQPTLYENIMDTSTNKTLASCVIIANLETKNNSISVPTVISLFFKPLDQYKKNGIGKYLCSFYDEINSKWNESGCTEPLHITEYGRYECSCNHLTSFALIWLPESLSSDNITKKLDAQDIFSLIFQCISIICFTVVIIHAISVKMANSSMNIPAINLLPLISTASTTMLFIFFIILSSIVYTQTSSANQTLCFTSSSVLMFIVYFLLIFMFCVKTSAGYFYYLRFVRLFPLPSYRKLSIMLIISFVLSFVCVILAIGFNSKSSFNVTQLYPYKLCWFTRHVIYYFLTIPLCIFLLINIITIILVTKSIIKYARNAPTTKQINERLKRCVVVLLSSCITQGIGWLVGPFISFLSPAAGNILSWIFIILNGLEGVWSIVLYILIRSHQIDKERSISAAIELLKSTGITSTKNKNSSQSRELTGNKIDVIQKTAEQEQPYAINDIRKRESTNFSFLGGDYNK